MCGLGRFFAGVLIKTDQGIDFLPQAEADELAGHDADRHRRDLYESIESGNAPSWTMKVQVMPFQDAPDYRFNPFDLTKVWPHGDYPLIDVGRMTLDRNPEDHFIHVEQAAFEPSNMVPGIGPSPDKMLLGRLFSYPDTHRYRIGPNYAQLPPNRPRTQVNSYAKDGPMRYEPARTARPYAPNSYGGPAAAVEQFGDPAGWATAGDMVREAYSLHREDDDWGQPGTMVREVLDDAARDRLVSNVTGHLSAGVSRPVLDRVLQYWRNIDKDIGDRIAKNVNGT
ncbi:catalase [Streptomyces sp. NPDC051219]|uniref:catalase n=1 Tax=Streptomyces sp. NPDC051219 TaxID=3155283 RepID=UPI003419B79B